MSIFEIKTANHCLQSLLCQQGFFNLLWDDDNDNGDDADKYDDDENVRALDQLNTFVVYGIIGRISEELFWSPGLSSLGWFQFCIILEKNILCEN